MEKIREHKFEIAAVFGILLFLVIGQKMELAILLISGLAIGSICSRGKKEDLAETYVPQVEEPRAELEELPIETLEGIGPKYGEKLRAKGIDTVAKLVVTPAIEVAKICGVGDGIAQRWIGMGKFCWLESVSEEDAEAIVYGGGIMGMDELAIANAEELLKEIETSVRLDHVKIPQGYTFTLDMVKSWIAEAKEKQNE